MRIQRPAICAAVIIVGLAPLAPAQQIHRDGFAGRETVWLRGGDNVRGVEKLHRVSDLHAHGGTTSEHVQVAAPVAHADPPYLNYYYPTPDAPITEDLAASVWVKANRAGVTLSARVVLPRESNPDRPDELMTTTITGARLPFPDRWYRLDLSRPTQLANQQRQTLRIQLGRDVDFTGAYIDRLILNVYTGAGQTDVFIDDLEIGPVVRRKSVPLPTPEVTARPTVDGPPTLPERTHSSVGRRGFPVRVAGSRLTINGEPFFFRAVRHTGTPLKTLADAGFNTVWFDADTEPVTIEEAIRHNLWIVPSVPLLDDDPNLVNQDDGTGFTNARTPEGLTSAVSRFLSGDGVLFWDLGGGRSSEQLDQVALTARAIEAADPRRPRGIDVRDGYRGYGLSVDMLGTHRWPLMSSLELSQYSDWLSQRRRLAVDGQPFFWTWIQTHVPQHQAELLYGEDLLAGSAEPVGPQPEQIRLLTYLALCSGCQGLGYWSDRFLADSHHGRDRLLTLALLNQELTMLEPILLSLNEPPRWIGTSDPSVKAVVMRSEKGVLVLPVWMGSGSQCVPGQGAVRNLGLVVPQVPNGAQPWLLGPAEIRSLGASMKRVAGGVQINIPEFDLTAAVVFTGDLSPTGSVVQWQDHARRYGKVAAQYSMDLAAEEIRKVKHVHGQLVQIAPPVTGAEGLLAKADQFLTDAQIAALNQNYGEAYRAAGRATRTLRVLTRAHWEQATRHMEVATASPYAASFYTLPRHWALYREMREKRLGATVLAGDFESAAGRPVVQVSARSDGVKGEGPLRAMGWEVAFGSLDGMDGEIELIDAETVADVQVPKSPVDPALRPYAPTSTNRLVDPEDARPKPNLGSKVLGLTIAPKVPVGADGKPTPKPAALERTYLAARTDWVSLPPGTLVRISCWMKILVPLEASADGALMFDSVGGEALGARQAAATIGTRRGTTQLVWKRYLLYRRVPESGRIRVTLMNTGIGSVYFDDVRIEPILGADRGAE